jgi:hypothetical protein
VGTSYIPLARVHPPIVAGVALGGKMLLFIVKLWWISPVAKRAESRTLAALLLQPRATPAITSYQTE